MNTAPVAGGFLTGKALIFPLSLVISLFFLWGFSYGLLDVLNKHFQTVLGITRLESTGLQVMYFGGGYLCFSPIAAEVLKRKGYKMTILMGLGFYSLGAVLFWPTAHFSSPEKASASFGGFCVCTLVIACGLATLETAANSYAVVIGDPALASARLQFCQSWNGGKNNGYALPRYDTCADLHISGILHWSPHRLQGLLLRRVPEQPHQRSVRLLGRCLRRCRRGGHVLLRQAP